MSDSSLPVFFDKTKLRVEVEISAAIAKDEELRGKVLGEARLMLASAKSGGHAAYFEVFTQRFEKACQVFLDGDSSHLIRLLVGQGYPEMPTLSFALGQGSELFISLRGEAETYDHCQVEWLKFHGQRFCQTKGIRFDISEASLFEALYLKVHCHMKVESFLLQNAMLASDPEILYQFRVNTKRSSIYLSVFKPDELYTEEGLEALKSDLSDRIREILAFPEGPAFLKNFKNFILDRLQKSVCRREAAWDGRPLNFVGAMPTMLVAKNPQIREGAFTPYVYWTFLNQFKPKPEDTERIDWKIENVGKAAAILQRSGFDSRLRPSQSVSTRALRTTSDTVDVYHRRGIELASESIRHVKSKERYIQAMTFGLTEQKINQVRDEIHQLMLELIEEEVPRSGGGPSKLVYFGSQFFPLTRYEPGPYILKGESKDRLEVEDPFWLKCLIHELTSFGQFQASPSWILPRIYAHVSEEQVNTSVKELERAKFIEFNSVTKKYHQVREDLITGDNVGGDVIKTYHQSMLDLALQTHDEIPAALRDFSAITFGIASDRHSIVTQKIHDTLGSVYKSSQMTDHPEIVFQLNMQLFPLALFDGIDRRPRRF